MSTSRVVVRSSEAALNMSVDAHKSVISDLVIRTKQAEEMTAILLSEKLTSEQRNVAFAQCLQVHIKDRANERAIHQQQVLQATSFAVNKLQQSLQGCSSNLDIDFDLLVGTVNTIAKGLITAIGNMHQFEKPRSTNINPSTPTENS